MQTAAPAQRQAPAAPAADRSRGRRNTPDLSHIPGPVPRPLVGHTVELVRDLYGMHRACLDAYGPVFKLKVIGVWRVTLAGPDALEYVLTDRDQAFSNREGWTAIEAMFSGGLLLRDGEDHRRHRRIMQVAFRAAAMRAYLARMNGEIARLLDGWQAGRSFRFHPAVKDLTLRLGGSVFMGLPSDAQADRLNRALSDEVAASLALIRRPLPFTPMRRGITGRRTLRAAFREMIPERRASTSEDFFSAMCRAEDEDGAAWSDEEIVDQFNFLMMAAHDTTATALTTMIWALTAHPEWQEAIAAEVAGLGEGSLDYDALGDLDVTDRVFREALRLVPPVPTIPRAVIRPITWQGFDLPAGTQINVVPGMVMVSPDIWTDPERFDPDRFSPDRAEDRRHRFAWAPFGGGAHKCIGMHFSSMQVKAFTVAFIRRFRVASAGRAAPAWRRLPIPKPADGLPVILTPVA